MAYVRCNIQMPWKIEQAKGAIQEAEVRDEGDPAVWVRVCPHLGTAKNEV
jgi:hypothetical protein